MMPTPTKAAPITESKLLALLDLYNDLLITSFHIRGYTEEYKHYKNIPKGKTLYEAPFYQDLLNLYNIIVALKIKPRDYIMFQVKNYKPPTRMSRMTPTIKMLTTPAAVEKWENQFVRPPVLSSQEDIDTVNAAYMHTLMQANGIKDEEEFYHDPILISQIARSFLVKNPIFKRLLNEGYYYKTFGLKASDLV